MRKPGNVSLLKTSDLVEASVMDEFKQRQLLELQARAKVGVGGQELLLGHTNMQNRAKKFQNLGD